VRAWCVCADSDARTRFLVPRHPAVAATNNLTTDLLPTREVPCAWPAPALAGWYCHLGVLPLVICHQKSKEHPHPTRLSGSSVGSLAPPRATGHRATGHRATPRLGGVYVPYQCQLLLRLRAAAGGQVGLTQWMIPVDSGYINIKGPRGVSSFP
jgi:hypothetical protein